MKTTHLIAFAEPAPAAPRHGGFIRRTEGMLTAD
jgi:hypothetical protein